MVVVAVLLFLLLKLLVKLLFKVTTIKRVNKLQEAIFKEITKQVYLQEVEDIAEGKELNNTPQQIPFEQFDEMYQRHNNQFGYSSEIDNRLMKDQREFKLNKISMVMLITTFSIVSVITLFTFIWGII